MKLAARLLQGFFAVAIFMSGIYFSIPFVSTSMKKTWLANSQLFYFMLTLTGFSLVIFFISAMAGLLDE